MDIEISGVLREGDECIILKVVDDCNLWPYVLIDNTYGPDGKVSNINRHLFIFPNKNVSEGDYIAIYTKVGTNTSFTNSQGSTTHKFFWGYDNDYRIWNKGGDRALLIKVSEYKNSNL